MDTRKITLIATIAVIALVAVGVGYAYTATTSNTQNNVDSEFVILAQYNYNFGGAGSAVQVYYDTDTVKGTNAGDSVTTYTLKKTKTADADDSITIGTGNSAPTYIGMLIGDDKLTASKTSVPAPAANTEISVTIEASGFADFSTKYWTYIIVLEELDDNGSVVANGDKQYVIYDGSASGGITYYKKDGTTSNTGLTMPLDKTYKTSLYFGGIASDGKAKSSNAPTYTPGVSDTRLAGEIIKGGVITFKHVNDA